MLICSINRRMPSPVCAIDEYLQDGEIMILQALNYVDLGVFAIKPVGK